MTCYHRENKQLMEEITLEQLTPETTKLNRQRKFIIQFVYWMIIILCAAAFAKYILPVLVPFIIAFIIAAILNKPVKYLSEKLHINRKVVAILCVIIFMSIAGGLITWLVTSILSSAGQIFSHLPGTFENLIIPLLQELFEKIENMFRNADPAFIQMLEANGSALLQGLSNGILKISNSIISSITVWISAVPTIFMKTVITVIVTFFIAVDYEKITGFIRKQIPEKQQGIVSQAKTFLFKTLPKFVVSYGFIFALTFVELWIGLALIGIPYAGLIALIISIFDILPVLGTGGILIPWSIIGFFIGNYRVAVGMALVYVVITVVRNIVEPKIIGKQMGLHPVLTLASMLIGLHLFGIIGLIGMPITLSFLKKIIFKEEIE